MLMYDIIKNKRDGGTLSEAELRYFIERFTSGEIPDYQASALLMAIWFRGMDERETAILTDAMARSGAVLDLSAIEGAKVDKHSTGGVGDKTTLICGPIVAAAGEKYGVKVAKLSGRGLGHTGGTIDKLESIPGLGCSLSPNRFNELVRLHGMAVSCASSPLSAKSPEAVAPADKLLYALRDVTATVDSLPLIASSIMSKKLAGGADAFVLDVKFGSGAFMEKYDDALKLAGAMVAIGRSSGKPTSAILTGMDAPLGYAIGNSLEVDEAYLTLKNPCGAPEDLREVSLVLAAEMLRLGSEVNGVKLSGEDAMELAVKTLYSGLALAKFREIVTAQGGDSDSLDRRSEAYYDSRDAFHAEIKACRDGYVTRIDTRELGETSVTLGAGREKKDDKIDFDAGILLKKKTGDGVHRGDVLAVLYSSDEKKLSDAASRFQKAFIIGEKPDKLPLIADKLLF